MILGLLVMAACILVSLLLIYLIKEVDRLKQWRQSVSEACRRRVELDSNESR